MNLLKRLHNLWIMSSYSHENVTETSKIAERDSKEKPQQAIIIRKKIDPIDEIING